MRARQTASFGAMYVGQALKRSAKLTYNNSIGKTVPNSTANYVNAASKIGNALETIGGYSLVGSTMYGQKKQYDIAKKYR